MVLRLLRAWNGSFLISRLKPTVGACKNLHIAAAAQIIATTMNKPQGLHQALRPAPVVLYDDDPVQCFKPKNVVVLTKITRYEFEKEKHPHLSETELAQELSRKGSDYETLKELHDYHKLQADRIVKALRKQGISTRLVNRYQYSDEAIDWADAVISAGGDGTFLLGANKLRNVRKPLIGINTDPRRSEGYLCLPKAESTNFAQSLEKIINGQFKWFYRQRIQIELCGPDAFAPPVELHEQQLDSAERRFSDWALEDPAEAVAKSNLSIPFDDYYTRTGNGAKEKNMFRRILPEVALNEVFIGESLSSRVSYYEISVDTLPSVKQKSSGVTICTGTGSTSWSFNINKLTDQATASIIKIIRDTGVAVPDDDNYVRRVAQRFNDELIFDASDTRMVYTVRDPVSNSIYATDHPRGFAHKFIPLKPSFFDEPMTVTIKSRCYDASLVIDGGPSYKFNDGAEAVLTIDPSHALRTVQLL